MNRELAICPKVDPTRPPSTAPPTPKPVKTTSKLAPSEAAAPSVAAETAHDDEEKEEEEEEEEEGLSQSTGYFRGCDKLIHRRIIGLSAAIGVQSLGNQLYTILKIGGRYYSILITMCKRLPTGYSDIISSLYFTAIVKLI